MQILYINVLTIEALTINNMSNRNKNFFYQFLTSV